jgi:hypothetical protein
MPYQFKREPLMPEEANRLASACQTAREKLLVQLGKINFLV